MFELPRGRISGKTLSTLVTLIRKSPLKHATAHVLRGDLGITALASLGADARGELPASLAPHVARNDHARASAELGIPTVGEHPRTIDACARALGAGRMHSEDLVRRSIDHARALARRSPSLGPILDFDEEGALAAARAADARRSQGKALGPLDGVPMAIKEEIDIRGLPTRVGTGFLSRTPAREDSLPVRRLREGGAVIIGSTPMTEYGMSPLGGNVHRVMPRNAHSEGHLPGGSSSGSGVAVATGVVPVALGADGGGSIRIPAAYNGVFGIKPTYGRVPVVGHGVPGGSSVVHLGPLGASAHDLAVFLELTSGGDARDPVSLAQPRVDRGEWVGAIGRGVRGLRIGVDEDEWSAASAEVQKAGRAALTALEREGAVLVPVGIRMARHAAPIGYLTIGLEFSANLREVRKAHMDELGLDLQMLFLNLETFLPDDYIDAQRLRSELRREIAALLADVDLLALPTTATTAPPVNDADLTHGFVDPVALDGACRFAFIGNLTGCPAGTAPVGFDASGLPIGVQFVGDAWDEACVLQALAHLERVGVAEVKKPSAALDLFA